MNCPNCGAYSLCNCTWDEIAQAINIQRRKEAAYRRRIGRPTVVEQEAREGREGEHESL